jgi:hypothetical protein
LARQPKAAAAFYFSLGFVTLIGVGLNFTRSIQSRRSIGARSSKASSLSSITIA